MAGCAPAWMARVSFSRRPSSWTRSATRASSSSLHSSVQRAPAARCGLERRERRAFDEDFAAMQREVTRMDRDASQSLRAWLYRMLVELNRWYAAQYQASEGVSPNKFVDRFRRVVDRDFARRHRLADYADRLGVSPGHLNALCKLHARRSAGAIIRARIVSEARKLLLYTELSAAEVGGRLGFDDPAYFARFFRRETGAAPTQFRAMSRPLP